MWMHVFFHSMLCFLVRSSWFGSPNTRQRCCIVGARQDVSDEMDLERLCAWVLLECPTVHERASLDKCFLPCGKGSVRTVSLDDFIDRPC